MTLPNKAYEALVLMAESETRPVAQSAAGAIIDVLKQRKFLNDQGGGGDRHEPS